ncbi:hypothetical protein C477_22975 [Haloterrigena salina JCM 13891]|uniref:Uncharacterized protein n=1 Tax=Haloterrigena salina JCM 13891 TaxID=1227488 RepID=M0BUN4_9EURY|nr:hypothetical protein [Haloterrigena salina]ELZ13369.1 hypothetical protein C477_22975 [Haloterrigena salina JCM 13891]
MTVTVLETIVENERVNAALAWPLVGAIALTAVVTARSGAFVWTGLATAVVALALVPTVLRWDALVMLPWELLAIAAAPLGLRLVGSLPIAGFLTVATIALLVTVELDAYTPIEMRARFAVVFVVLATMAVAGCWVILQWMSDALLGTAHLTETTEVMWDLVYATAFGGLAGAVFVGYFFRHDAAGGVRRGNGREWGDGRDREPAGDAS